MHGGPSVHLVRKILAAAIALRADERALLDGVGLTDDELADPEAHVAHAKLLRLWDVAERLTGDAAFGLRFSELSQLQPDNALAYAALASSTVAELLNRSARYAGLIHGALEIGLIHDGARCRWRFVMRHPLGTSRHGVEAALGMATLFCRRQADGRFALDEVSFRHAAPPSTAAHERVFAAPVRFGAEHDELVFARAHLELRLRRGDSELARHLDRHLDAVQSRAVSSPELLRRVARAIGEDLSGGVPDIGKVAGALKMSPRSLQRALRGSGSSFQAVLNQLRRDLATRYLSDPRLAVGEVAFLVGFAELANFHRAFKRWTGMTPGECRRRAKSGELRA